MIKYTTKKYTYELSEASNIRLQGGVSRFSLC